MVKIKSNIKIRAGIIVAICFMFTASVMLTGCQPLKRKFTKK